jgi:hypothetical protein
MWKEKPKEKKTKPPFCPEEKSSMLFLLFPDVYHPNPSSGNPTLPKNNSIS